MTRNEQGFHTTVQGIRQIKMGAVSADVKVAQCSSKIAIIPAIRDYISAFLRNEVLQYDHQYLLRNDFRTERGKLNQSFKYNHTRV